MPDHPDQEQLAAFQAGDGERRQRADIRAHLEGCPSCAELVASVEHARRQLALLQEPELPPGLHDRLAAAVDSGAAREVPHRPTPWYRRPVAWGAAAALLLAALVTAQLDLSGGGDITAAGGQAAREATAPGFGGGAELPVIRLPGEVSAAVVRSRLSGDPVAELALERATAAARSGTDRALRPGAQSPSAASTGQGETAAPDATAPPGDASPGRTGAVADRQPCLAAATAAADRAIRPLVAAFYLEGTYKGRQATVLVTTSAARPGRTDLWVFPRGDCTARPLATERVE